MAQICKTLAACLFALCAALFASGCKPLKSPTAIHNAPIDAFKYAYVIPTRELTSSAGGAYSVNGVLFGTSTAKSVNPADIIVGALIKKGFIILPEVKQEQAPQTLIVAYGESGRRNTGWGAYAIEVSIQFASASTSEPLCSCVAEGRGETEADDIRQAIDRCLSALFDKNL